MSRVTNFLLHESPKRNPKFTDHRVTPPDLLHVLTSLQTHPPFLCLKLKSVVRRPPQNEGNVIYNRWKRRHSMYECLLLLDFHFKNGRTHLSTVITMNRLLNKEDTKRHVHSDYTIKDPIVSTKKREKGVGILGAFRKMNLDVMNLNTRKPIIHFILLKKTLLRI